MSTSEGGERNLEYFQEQKLPWLQTVLQERGIQTSLKGKDDINGGGRPTQLLTNYPLILEFGSNEYIFVGSSQFVGTIRGSLINVLNYF